MLSQSTPRDARGVPVSSCQPTSLDDYETALYQFQSYFGDPTETLLATVKNDPEFVMGHIFIASALLPTSEKQYLSLVNECLDKAEALAHKSNSREKALIQAARRFTQGDWQGACALWDRVLGEYPLDAMALQCAHLTDFLLGDAINLRDRISRVLPHWSPDMPGYSFILGMYAFGLEECHQYTEAEEMGRRALSIDARDGWSVHAVTHVMEMQNRFQEGQNFLRASVNNWAPDNGLAFHNWWHLALFHLEENDFDGAIQLYDEKIFIADSDASMQLADAAAMLWRMHLQGVSLDKRWQDVSALWQRKTEVENGYYAFNDLHVVMSMVGAGQLNEAESVLADLVKASTSNPPLTAMMARDIGIPACKAIIAHGKGKHEDVIDLLLPIRSYANRFGGSHAQRDILSQTLLDSALHAKQWGIAKNILNERAVNKASSPLTERYKARLANSKQKRFSIAS